MMTLEEAIQHAREVALSNAACGVAYRKGGQMMLADGCDACAAEHEQLAEWLTELKQRREAEVSEKPKTNGDRIRQMTDEELAEHLGSYICDNRTSQDCKRIRFCKDCRLEWLREEVSEDD